MDFAVAERHEAIHRKDLPRAPSPAAVATAGEPATETAAATAVAAAVAATFLPLLAHASEELDAARHFLGAVTIATAVAAAIAA